MTLDKVVMADLADIRTAIHELTSAHATLRRLGVRRAAILTAQALRNAESARDQIEAALKGK